jgi:hypothetical protein
LEYGAKHLPLANVRERRDWERFLTFCKAIALCRGFRSGHPVNIEFPDYCVAYRILEPVFASTLRGLPTQPLMVASAATRLNARFKRGVTAQEIARELDWERPTVYKHAETALALKLIRYEKGAREKNIKLIRARGETKKGFLPSPRKVLRNNKQIERKVKYVDPFTGTWKRVKK